MKKRLCSWLLVLAMVLSMLPVSVLAAGNVIEVSDQAGLAAMTDGSYKLSQDITLENWMTRDFNGTLDGNGYTITLTGAPLFGTLKGTVFNLILDGQVTQTANKNTGALCESASGATIRNCISDVAVTYSGSSSWVYVGQLSGTFNSSTNISNCLILGSLSYGAATCYGAAGASYYTPSINNCVAVGYSTIATKEGYPTNSAIEGINCTLLDSAEGFVPTNFVDTFNTNRAADDLEWEVQDGNLTLKRAAVVDATDEELTALAAAIEAAEAVDKTRLYTADSWDAFDNALSTATSIATTATPTQSSVVTATTSLTNATAALAERNINSVCLLDKDVVSITTADELEYMQDGKYYRLDADITLGQYWFGYFNTMNSVLDGNGHTITLIGKPLWSAIGPNGVIQNLGIKGSAQNSQNDTGAMAKDSSGLIVNCWSQVAVTAAGTKTGGGLVANLKSGGAIINSYVTGSISTGGTSGALAGTAEENTLTQNCYWQNSVSSTAVGSGFGIVSDNAPKAEREIKTADFVALLNENRDDNGKVWTQSDSGYPHLGAAGNYQPPEPLEITFTNYKGEGITFSSDDGLNIPLSAQNTTTDRGYAGELSCAGVTSWNNLSHDGSGQNNILYLYDLDENGCAEVYLNKIGTATIEANDSNNTRFTITVTDSPNVHDLRLKTEGQAYTDGSSMTVQGSEYVHFTAEAQYEEGGEWEALPAELLKFTAVNGTGSAHLTENTFHATAPGTMSVTATYEGLDASGEAAAIVTKHVTVNITSEYVPIASITPDANGEYVIHGRNANSSDSGEFLDLKLGHATGSVSVSPANASYKDDWKLESSDPTVAEYVDAFLKAVLPKKAGTVTLTATATGPDETATGSTTITIKYANPVTAVAIDGSSFAVEAGSKIDLPITFTGADDRYAYVTEPGMEWSYESSNGGKVAIIRDGNEGILTGSADPQEYCVGNPAYQIKGISAGTVTVTGTPIDTTNSVAPVTFTVTVTGDAPAVDTDKLVADGIRGAQNYITENGLDDLAYGFEWSVFSMMRSGGTVPQSGIDAYLDSVEATYNPTPAVDSEEMNPTTLARVAIALGALGENAANFRGINFIKHLYSSDRIAAPAGTSNDASYALIAMDTQKYSVPTNAKWTRENLIHEILAYQNANGGFGLTDSTSVSADITAMALQALAPYYSSDPQVKEATDRAVAWLKGEMSADGIFAGTADSTAQVLTALAALGIDPADTESGFDGLLPGILSFQSANGGFNYGNKVNLMTTHQALYALEAYRRSVSGENALYDMTDAVTDPRAVLERRLAEANTLIEGDYTAESWAAMAEARAAAQDVFANESATADDLVAADAALKHAIAALVKESSSSGSDKNSISAYVTIIDKGKVVVPQLIVSVTDQNNSGGYDVDDALYAAHKATYPGGAANGYASYTGDYGLAISKLWGDTGYAYGYWLNNASCWSLADPITAGDHLVAFVYQDGIGWSDAYSMFDRFNYTATADAALTVRTESAGYDESWNTVFSAFSAANITAYDDTFHTLTADKYTVVNHGDGSYSVTFDDTGFYYLVASCSDPLTVPAVSTITVSAAAGTPSRPDGKVDVVYIRVADPYGTTYLRKTTCEFEDGETAYSLLLKTGLSVDSRRSEYGVYVESIEGLGEFDEGSGSGWMYKVNGEFPGYSSALYDLSSGDYVEWVYTRDLGEDVGGGSSSGPKFAEEDRAVAREVKNLISAIGTVTKDSGDAIKAARAAYDALTDTQKDLVPNYDDLVTAEKKYAELTKDEQVFADVSEDAYYYEAVKWAMEKGITSGTSETTFSPNASCTRAQMVTFLWRAAGSPKAAATTCNFTDIAKDAYYYEALLWAVENGITSGTSATTFSPDVACSRGQMAMFLYRSAKTPSVSGDNSFRDVSGTAYYNDAIIWAKAEGITAGTSATTFSPDDACTRSQMVTFLYRYLAE